MTRAGQKPELRIDLRRRLVARDARRGPVRFAHRGASARAPENTLAAFEEAARLGADFIECDVQLSADGAPIIIHDDRVERTTDGRGAVAALTFAALRRLDAGSWFDPRFGGERLPTLAETLEFARGRCGLNLEIKGGPDGRRRPDAADEVRAAATVSAVARALHAAAFKDPLIVSSFSPAALRRARQALPRVRLGLLASRSLRGVRALHRQAGLHSVHPNVRMAGRRRVRAAHGLGLRVYFWTVNHPDLMRRLVDLGADGMMSDDPALFHELDPSPGDPPLFRG